MATIRYTKTYFKEPLQISEENYNTIRKQLVHNPNFEIDPNPETFSKHFKDQLKIIKIVCGWIILYLIVFGDNSENKAPIIFNLLTGLAVMILFFSIAFLLLEGPSYATYVKSKKTYFSRMKYAIQNSSSYREFLVIFYK